MASHTFSDANSETEIMVLKKVIVPGERIAFWIRCIAVSSVVSGIGLFSVAGLAHASLVESTDAEGEKSQIVLEVSQASVAERSRDDAQKIQSQDWKTVAPTSFVYTSEPSTAPVVAPEVSSKQDFLKQQNWGRAQELLKPAVAPEVVAQAPSTSEDAETLRQRLVIDPLVELRPVSYTPGSTVGVPSAFGANYGDAFVGISFSNRRPRVNEADGAITAGFGLGDSERYVGLEVSANIGSLRRFAANGDFGFKLHRSLPGKAAIALGWDSGITWGEENRNTVSTLYGVASKVFDLRPQNIADSLPLTVTLGVGGGRFRSFENVVDRKGGVGVFGSVGLRVVPQASVIASWTGQDLNLGVSYVPIRTTPLYLTAVVGNVLSRNDNATLFSFGIGYGFNYAGYQY